jgi:hypothetical protein
MEAKRTYDRCLWRALWMSDARPLLDGFVALCRDLAVGGMAAVVRAAELWGINR